MNLILIRIRENIGINPSILIGRTIILILFNHQVLTLRQRRFLLAAIKLFRSAKFVNVMLTSFSLALANFCFCHRYDDVIIGYGSRRQFR